jgi:hypothetical protein
MGRNHPQTDDFVVADHMATTPGAWRIAPDYNGDQLDAEAA